MGFLGRAGLVVLALLSAGNGALAAPSLRVQVTQRGDFVLIGNTLGHDCRAGGSLPVVGTVGSCGASFADSAPDLFWRADSPMDGQAQANTTITATDARSTAVLNLPAGAEVTHAYLYWAATASAPGPDTSVNVERGGVVSLVVTAIQSYASVDNAYQSVADVTELVQTYGSGAYRVGGVAAKPLANVDDEKAFAGWWMVVFYKLATEPRRNLALFDGLDPISSGSSQTATLSSFPAPALSGAKLGVVAFEGDDQPLGDQLLFNGEPALSNGANPATNFFNSTRSYLGSPVSHYGDLPQLTGTAQVHEWSRHRRG